MNRIIAGWVATCVIAAAATSTIVVAQGVPDAPAAPAQMAAPKQSRLNN